MTGAGFGTVVEADAAVAVIASVEEGGVPERLGWPLTVRSFPWVSMSATGNSANLASRAGGRRVLTKAKSALTSGLEAVSSVQLYCDQNTSTSWFLRRVLGNIQHSPTAYPA